MEQYHTVGKLLEDLRKSKGLSQAKMAEQLHLSTRTYSRYELNQTRIDVFDLAETTKIPLEVLFRLSHGYPTQYNVETRRYSLCPFDNHYINSKVLHKLLFNTPEVGNIVALKDKANHTSKMINVDFPFYPYKNKISGKVLYEASNILPELNISISDPYGYYSGHMICIPLKLSSYNNIRRFNIPEHSLSINDLAEVNNNNQIALHIFSLFTTNSTYAYCIAKRLVYFLIGAIQNKISDTSILSRYVFTDDGIEFCRKFMLVEPVEYGFDDHKQLELDIVPHFFEIQIKDIAWLDNYRTTRK